VTDRLAVVRQLTPSELAWLLGRVSVVADALNGQGPLGTYGLYQQPRAGTLRRLATLLATPRVIHATLGTLTRFELQLVSLAAWHGGSLTRDQAIAEAGPTAGKALDAAADTLVRLLLADRTRGSTREKAGASAPAGGRGSTREKAGASAPAGGRGSTREKAGASAPAGGRGLRGSTWLALRPGVEEIIGFTGVRMRDVLANESSHALGEMLRGLGQRPLPRRSEWLGQLEASLRDRATLDAVIAKMPKDASRVFWLLAEHGPQSVRDLGIPYYQWYARDATPLHWLTQRGLVGVDPGAQIAHVWLDVIVGLNGCLYREWPATPPPVTAVPIEDSGGLPLVLNRLDALLEMWAAEPAPTLASGGLGVRPVRAAAKALGVPAGEVGLLVHLAIGMGLLDRTMTGTKGSGRQRANVYGWAPTELAPCLKEQPAAQRWALLLQAWRDDTTLDESKGLPERWEATEFFNAASWGRIALLRLLADLPPGRGLTMDDLAATVAFHHPGLFRDRALAGVVDAARVLGLVPASGPIGLTRLGRALLDGPGAVEAALPAPRADFTLQADHTVIAPPDLAHDVMTRLERYADVESAAGARIYRLSERRIAAALDDGERAAGILGFLEEHSTVPVPQNVAHLIRDCERRHGRLRAGTVSSYLRCDDPALLTRAVAVKAAKLHLLAPTVAVSALATDKLVAALRARGLMPVAEAPDGVALARPTKVASTKSRQLPELRSTTVFTDQAVMEALAKQVLENHG
jgi:Helicase conserved C-terminal domain